MPVSGGSLLLWVTFPKSGVMEGREGAGRGDVSLAACIMKSEQRGGRRSASGCGFQLNFFFFFSQPTPIHRVPRAPGTESRCSLEVCPSLLPGSSGRCVWRGSPGIPPFLEDAPSEHLVPLGASVIPGS